MPGRLLRIPFYIIKCGGFCRFPIAREALNSGNIIEDGGGERVKRSGLLKGFQTLFIVAFFGVSLPQTVEGDGIIRVRCTAFRA